MQPTSATATAISAALAAQAESVCRHFLPNGRREGRYWVVGDVHGSRGKSLFIRLRGPGLPGKWNDMATGQHGDLLDIIRHRSAGSTLRDALAEARTFLALPQPLPGPHPAPASRSEPSDAALRLWNLCKPIQGTHAEAYLQARGIRNCAHASLRFHPALHYRHRDDVRTLPALVAAATDPRGRITGILRTYLDPERPAKARVPAPKKALGSIIGSTVRFSGPKPDACIVAGEGIETVLSILTAYPGSNGAATLSAAGLGAFDPPPDQRVAIARDRGPEGIAAAMRLAERCMTAGNTFRILPPLLEDFNDDLVAFGPEGIRRGLAPSLLPSRQSTPPPEKP